MLPNHPSLEPRTVLDTKVAHKTIKRGIKAPNRRNQGGSVGFNLLLYTHKTPLKNLAKSQAIAPALTSNTTLTTKATV